MKPQVFVEPKVVLANERTYIAWTKMAVTLGSISAGLLGAAADNSQDEVGVDGAGDSSVHSEILWWIGALLLPVAIIFALYALATYRYRNAKIQKLDYDDLTSETVPLLLGGILTTALTAVFLIDFSMGGAVKLK